MLAPSRRFYLVPAAYSRTVTVSCRHRTSRHAGNGLTKKSGSWSKRNKKNINGRQRSVISPSPSPENDLIVGVNAVASVLEAGARDSITRIYISDNSVLMGKGTSGSVRLRRIHGLATAAGIPLVHCGKRVLDALAANVGGSHHQGVAIEASKLHPPPPPPPPIGSRGTGSPAELWLVLDRIHDPMNLGAVLRSALFFGVNGVVLAGCAPLSPTVVRASAGATEWLRLHRVLNAVELVEELHDSGWDTIATVAPPLHTDENSHRHKDPSLVLEKLTFDVPVALVLGNEGDGIQSKITRVCNIHTTIPTAPSLDFTRHTIYSLDSLNVGVTAGILLHVLAKSRNLAKVGSV